MSDIIVPLKQRILTPEVEALCEPAGVQCHKCGSDRVYELEEVSPSNWNKVIGVFYVCNECGTCWQYALSKKA